jgi:hypothetical protein
MGTAERPLGLRGRTCVHPFGVTPGVGGRLAMTSKALIKLALKCELNVGL